MHFPNPSKWMKKISKEDGYDIYVRGIPELIYYLNNTCPPALTSTHERVWYSIGKDVARLFPHCKVGICGSYGF